MVLVLLPPSEGKTAPVSGTKLQMDTLSLPTLSETRERIARALISACTLPDQEVLSILKCGEQTLPDIRANLRLFESPCAPAAQVYTGVLYEAAHLQPHDTAIIFSGLFGLTTAHDAIPLYRLAMNVRLPDVGSVAHIWKQALSDVTLSAMQHVAGSHDNVVFDARSAAYQVWPAAKNPILTHIPDDKDDNNPWPFWTLKALNNNGRTITHRAKYYRGLMARTLLDAGTITNSQVPQHARKMALTHGLGRPNIDEAQRIITLYV